jgi:hypothetical protein
MMSGSANVTAEDSRSALRRALTIAASSARRRPMVSVSVPTSALADWASAGRACGSQRTHSQSSRPPASVSR